MFHVSVASGLTVDSCDCLRDPRGMFIVAEAVSLSGCCFHSWISSGHSKDIAALFMFHWRLYVRMFWGCSVGFAVSDESPVNMQRMLRCPIDDSGMFGTCPTKSLDVLCMLHCCMEVLRPNVLWRFGRHGSPIDVPSTFRCPSILGMFSWRCDVPWTCRRCSKVLAMSHWCAEIAQCFFNIIWACNFVWKSRGYSDDILLFYSRRPKDIAMPFGCIVDMPRPYTHHVAVQESSKSFTHVLYMS